MTRNTNSPCTGDDVISCSDLKPLELGISLQRGEACSKCRFTSKYVESELLCNGTLCKVTRMRLSQRAGTPPREWTILDAWSGCGVNSSPALRFISNIVDAFASRASRSGGTSIIGGYVASPQHPNAAFHLSTEGDFGSYESTNETLTASIAQIFNSYWLANIGSEFVTESWGDDFQSFDQSSAYDWRLIADSLLKSEGTNASMFEIATLNVSTPEEHIVCQRSWLIRFTTVTVVALSVSILDLVLRSSIEARILP